MKRKLDEIQNLLKVSPEVEAFLLDEASILTRERVMKLYAWLICDMLETSYLREARYARLSTDEKMVATSIDVGLVLKRDEMGGFEIISIVRIH